MCLSRVKKYSTPTTVATFRVISVAASCAFYTAYVVGYLHDEEEADLSGGTLALAIVNIGTNAFIQIAIRVPAIFRKHFKTKVRAQALHANHMCASVGDAAMHTSYYTANLAGFFTNFFSSLSNFFGFVIFLTAIELLANDDPDRPALVAVNTIFGLAAMLTCLYAYSAYTIEAIKDNTTQILNTLAANNWHLNQYHAKAFAVCIFGAISNPCLLYVTTQASLLRLPFMDFPKDAARGIAASQIPFIIITDLTTTFVAAYQFFKSKDERTPELHGGLKWIENALVLAVLFDSSMTGLSHHASVARRFANPYGWKAFLIGIPCGISAAMRNALFNGYYGFQQVKAHDIPRLFPNHYRRIGRDTGLTESVSERDPESQLLLDSKKYSVELTNISRRPSISDSANRYQMFPPLQDHRAPAVVTPTVLDVDITPLTSGMPN